MTIFSQPLLFVVKAVILLYFRRVSPMHDPTFRHRVGIDDRIYKIIYPGNFQARRTFDVNLKPKIVAAVSLKTH